MVCRVQRHVEEEAKELLGWRELGGEHRLAFMTVAKEMGYSPLHAKPLTRSEHAPLAIHHELQLSCFDDEFLVCIGMKVLPKDPVPPVTKIVLPSSIGRLSGKTVDDFADALDLGLGVPSRYG